MLHKLHNSFFFSCTFLDTEIVKEKKSIIHFLSYYTFMYILSFIWMPFLFADQFRYVIKQIMFLFFIKNESTDWSSWIYAKFAGLV